MTEFLNQLQYKGSLSTRDMTSDVKGDIAFTL